MQDNWEIIQNKNNLLITGPGELEIILPDFDWQKSILIRNDEWFLKGWSEVTVKYSLDNLVALEVTITSIKKDTFSSSSQPEIALLSVGEWVSWYLDIEFADRLQNLLLGKD